MKKLATIGIIALVLSGCADIRMVKKSLREGESIFKGNPYLLRGLPQGTDSYSRGVRDGCETAMGIMGAGTLRLLKPKINGYQLVKDPLYTRAFIDGMNYCNFYLDWDVH